MTLGIKVGLKNNYAHDLTVTNAPLAEVWYNATESDRYKELFENLKKRQINVGLHFWGSNQDGILANIAYPDKELLAWSINLMKGTIDAAATEGFHYVNIHPGARAKVKVDFTREHYEVMSPEVALSVAEPLFLEHVKDLDQYARSRGVVFTVETVCPRATNNWYKELSRLKPLEIYELPTTSVVKASEFTWIANDFAHTAAQATTGKPLDAWTVLLNTTKEIAPKTRLIHMGFLIPPFNGTDYHDHLDNPQFVNSGAVPNRAQVIELLQLFKQRSDMWILVEPNGHHDKNYHLAKQLLQDSSIEVQ